MHKIALIDSGVGGLSIYSAIQPVLPNSQFTYLADHLYAPYGNKDPHWVAKRTVQLANHLTVNHQPDCIVIACNTASTLSLAMVRESLRVPIIGVVPAIKTAANLSASQKIGLLATPATINGQYINQLIEQFASHCHVTKIGSTHLVNMAEDKLSGITVAIDQLEKHIKPFIQAKCDQVVLGCTHFPLLRAELESISPNIQWVDSSNAIANRCLDVLSTISNTESLTPNSEENKNQFFSTGIIREPLKHNLANLGFNNIVESLLT